jgi:pimeloyl-ACP methyl ester carboxylesterase
MQEYFLASVDGVSTYVAEYDAFGAETGPPIVCLHGLTRNSKDFRDIVEPLQGMGRRVVTLDVRGRGKSDRDPNWANYNPLVYAQDVLMVLEKRAIERAVFIGTSMGGIITMIIASFAPHKIAGAVLNDVGPELHMAGVKRIQGYVGVSQTAKTWEEAALRLKAVGDSTYPGRELSFWIDLIQRNSIMTPAGIVYDYDPAIAQAGTIAPDAPLPTLWDQFAALQPIPTACIRGALSDLLSSDIVARMAEVKPDLIIAEVPRVGHAPMLNEPEAWRAIEMIVRKTK